MVTKRIMLGHKVLIRGIEVNQAKIKEIKKLPPLTLANGIRVF